MDVLEFIASNARSTAGNPPMDMVRDPMLRIVRLATSASGYCWGALVVPGDGGWEQPTVFAPESVHPCEIPPEYVQPDPAASNAEKGILSPLPALRTKDIGLLAQKFSDCTTPQILNSPSLPSYSERTESRPSSPHDLTRSESEIHSGASGRVTSLCVAGIALHQPQDTVSAKASLPGLATSGPLSGADAIDRPSPSAAPPPRCEQPDVTTSQGPEDRSRRTEAWGVLLLLTPAEEGTTSPTGITGDVRDALEDAAELAGTAAERFLASVSNVRYRRFLAESDQGIYRMEVDPPIPITADVEDQLKLLYDRGYIAECNDALAKMYGADSPEDLVGMTARQLHADDMEANRRTQRAFIERGYRLSNAVTGEYDQKGNLRWFSNTAFSIIIDQHLHRIWGIQQDITEIKETKEALDHSERLLRSTLDSYPYATAIFDAELRYLYANELATAPIASDLDNVIGERPEDVYPERVWKPLLPLLERCRETENFTQRVVTVERDDEERIVIASFVPLFSKRDNLEAIIASTRDVTEERRAKRRLRQSEQRLSLHVEHSPLAFIEWDVSGRIVQWNPSARRTFGYTAREARGLHITDLSPYADRDATEDLWSSMVDHQQTFHQQRRRNLTKAGRVILCEWSMTPLVDHQGRVVGVAATAQDVTQGVEAREALRQERDLLQGIAETSAAGIVVADADGNVSFVNTRAETLLRTRRASLSQNFLDAAFWAAHHLDGSDVEASDLPFQRVIETGNPVFDAELVLSRPPEEVILSINAAPILDDQGDVSQVVLAMEDITDRMQRQLRTREHNEVLSSIANVQVELRDDWKGVIRYTARAAQEALQADRLSVWLIDETKAFECVAVAGPEARDDMGRIIDGTSYSEYIDTIRKRRSLTSEDVRVDDRLGELASYHEQRNIVSTLDAPVRVGGRLVGVVSAEHIRETRTWTAQLQTFAGSIADIVAQAFIVSEQKKAKAALRRSEQRWKALVEHHPGGVLITQGGTIEYLNATTMRIFGAKHDDQVLGLSVVELIHPDHHSKYYERLEQIGQTDGVTEPWTHEIIGLDGTHRTIVAQSISVTYQGKPAAQTVIRDVTAP